MPESKRKFVHDVSSTLNFPHDDPLRVSQLAVVYRIDTQMVDREPHRSVQLTRRIDTRIPPNLLSQSSSASATLGKLADLRAPARASPPSAALASSGAPRASRGWSSVLTTPGVGTPPPGAPSVNSLSAWTGSERASRPTTPSQSLVQPVATEAARATAPSTEAGPDNWEDDT
jgi:transcriptional repressor NF-X1